MSIKINCSLNDFKFYDSWIGYFAIHTMTEASTNQKKDILKFFNITPGQVELEFEIKINDVEINFEEFMNYIQEQDQNRIQKAAVKMLEEKCYNLQELMNKVQTNIENLVEETLPSWEKDS